MATADDVVSSSSKLWAVRKYLHRYSLFSHSAFISSASKEWVIPAKPKPGRKPKKDTSTLANEETEASPFLFPPFLTSVLMKNVCCRATQIHVGAATGKRPFTENGFLVNNFPRSKKN